MYGEYGKVTVTRGNRYVYLGMNMEFIKEGSVNNRHEGLLLNFLVIQSTSVFIYKQPHAAPMVAPVLNNTTMACDPLTTNVFFAL